LLINKDLRPSKHYLLMGLMLLRRRSRRTHLYHINTRMNMQRNKYDNQILIIHLFSHSKKTYMNINGVNITLIPSACSKARMRESEYNPA
jgi:hypothetical protein